ncbi:Com family DNA-binding transcriptional regulator [Senegalia massiliensis]|uniref:Com family DNA-binding transcriptional regulator n=1 Tax=Senegalia massiliensis TaxID=1720316 RepID=A0A845R4B9_9CLOT|nr:Com family DNA-binding transcriptional regulator [Senegalia massiliensis]NBI08262.1 Com family DNA-binding transcriptional regulator [Senegalia massiliensis]
MQEIRCKVCSKLLGRVPKATAFEIEMKCPRCKSVRIYNKEALEAQG